MLRYDIFHFAGFALHNVKTANPKKKNVFPCKSEDRKSSRKVVIARFLVIDINGEPLREHGGGVSMPDPFFTARTYVMNIRIDLRSFTRRRTRILQQLVFSISILLAYMLLLVFTVFVLNPNLGRTRLVRSRPPKRLSPLNSWRFCPDGNTIFRVILDERTTR